MVGNHHFHPFLTGCLGFQVCCVFEYIDRLTETFTTFRDAGLENSGGGLFDEVKQFESTY